MYRQGLRQKIWHSGFYAFCLDIADLADILSNFGMGQGYRPDNNGVIFQRQDKGAMVAIRYFENGEFVYVMQMEFVNADPVFQATKELIEQKLPAGIYLFEDPTEPANEVRERVIRTLQSVAGQ